MVSDITVSVPDVYKRQPPHRVTRVNWRSFHDELGRTVPSDPQVDISSPDDVDRLADYLQEAVTSAMDKHTYHVPAPNRRSQLPEEVILAIRNRRQLRRRWQQTRDPAVKRRLNAQSALVKQLLLDATAPSMGLIS